jgi:hypothetical protein
MTGELHREPGPGHERAPDTGASGSARRRPQGGSDDLDRRVDGSGRGGNVSAALGVSASEEAPRKEGG